MMKIMIDYNINSSIIGTAHPIFIPKLCMYILNVEEYLSTVFSNILIVALE